MLLYLSLVCSSCVVQVSVIVRPCAKYIKPTSSMPSFLKVMVLPSHPFFVHTSIIRGGLLFVGSFLCPVNSYGYWNSGTDGTFSDICFTRLAWLIMTGHFGERETPRLSPSVVRSNCNPLQIAHPRL